MNYLKERRLKANFEPVAFEEILQLLKDKKLHINDDTFSQVSARNVSHLSNNIF